MADCASKLLMERRNMGDALCGIRINVSRHAGVIFIGLLLTSRDWNGSFSKNRLRWLFEVEIQVSEVFRSWNKVKVSESAWWKHFQRQWRHFHRQKTLIRLISSETLISGEKKLRKCFSKTKFNQKRGETLLPAYPTIVGVEKLLFIILSHFYFWSSRPLTPNWINPPTRAHSPYRKSWNWFESSA